MFQEVRICKECGKEFIATNGKQMYCKEKHFDRCVVCGSVFEIPESRLREKDRSRCCSRKCSSELRKATNLDRYGGPAPASSSKVREKMEQTNLDRYGVRHAAQNEQIKNKIVETNLDKYGEKYYTQTQEGRSKISESWKSNTHREQVKQSTSRTNKAKYGTDHPMKNSDYYSKWSLKYSNKTGYSSPLSNPDVRKKIKQTMIDQYGVEYPLQNPDIKLQWEQTNQNIYGAKNPMQNINIRTKALNTCLERYGNTCFLQSDLGRKMTASRMYDKYGKRWMSQTYDWKSNRMKDPSKINNLMQFDNDVEDYITRHFDKRPTLNELSESLGTGTEAVSMRLARDNKQDLVEYVYSYMENSVYNFIKSIDSKIVIERNTHKVITPYELDIYLPEYKIGIECNPTSTHNSSVNTFSKDEPPLKYDYHLMKTKKCEEQGIFLFHIFGSEWEYSTDIIKSMIRNLLGRSKRKIYARNCDVKEIDSTVCRNFLNSNHRQGNVNSKVRLGLYLDDELVSVMTFGKMRQSIGTDGTDLSDCWELVRFCSVLDTSVIGGASKLFKYFIDNWKPDRVRSFSDRAHTRGALYSKLGFNFIRYSDPGYVWVDSRTDISYHRYSAQKQNIRKFLHDDSIDLSKTEKQIMEENGFLQVFDCGTLLWEWCKN